MHAALQRLGFSSQAATDIMGDQGIDSLGELRVLDKKEVESLFEVVRRPGGPTSTAGATVSLWAEANLKRKFRICSAKIQIKGY